MATSAAASSSSSFILDTLPVGCRFHPKDHELLGYYLINKVRGSGTPLVPEFDLYGVTEPWDIWTQFGGPQLDEGEDLFFFTNLKKHPGGGGKRIVRTVGSSLGSWKGENKGTEVKHPKNKNQVLGLRKRFHYENEASAQHRCWIMVEYSLHHSLISNSSTTTTTNDEYVVCRLRKNENHHKRYHHKRKYTFNNNTATPPTSTESGSTIQNNQQNKEMRKNTAATPPTSTESGSTIQNNQDKKMRKSEANQIKHEEDDDTFPDFGSNAPDSPLLLASEERATASTNIDGLKTF